MSSDPSSPTLVESSTGTPGESSGGAPPAADAMRELSEFLSGLLRTQCAAVGGLGGAVYLTGGSGRAAGLIAQHWHPSAMSLASSGTLSRLEKLASEVCASGGGDGAKASGRVDALVPVKQGGGSAAMYGEQEKLPIVAAPLFADGRVEGASVLVLATKVGGGMEPALAMQTVMLAGAAFEGFLWRRQAMFEAERTLMLRQTIELLDAAQQGPNAGVMGAILCQELKRRFGCTRVSVGLVKGDFIRVVAISGVDEIDRAAPAVEAIESVMEECAAQDTEVQYPVLPAAEADPGQRRVTRAHEELSKKFGPSAVLSLPLRVEGDLVGVAVMERDAADPFPSGAVPLLRLVAETVGPALWTRRLADRGILEVVRDRTLEMGSWAVGPRNTGWKLLGALVAAMLVLALIVPIPDRVWAAGDVRAASLRSISPPFSGFLDKVLVKPGDSVMAGQVLALMRADELLLQLEEAKGRAASLEAQRDEALGRQELGKVSVLEAQVSEVKPTIARLEDAIERATIRSPIAGVVGRGDLDQFVGSRIEPTQALFEIVSGEHTAIVSVKERDVQRVKLGAEGWLVLKGKPSEPVRVRVKRITPVSELTRNENVYPVEVELLEQPAWLRAGISGNARITTGSTTPLIRLARPLADEMRLRLWW